ncbi:MFS transporter [Spirochaeta isovalerica]|uniref:MFS family permease n=1 Tax=Spirochaeta isovalerica TaxID=150 RepID=A0A841RDD7_9SPIO|nr:MFS transporter [Spirochaeta isovalerica]MBB6481401.1 MFS family permease [Spirochaeta isovalerica]
MEITADQRSSYRGFLVHGIFLALTVTFTEINSVLPALVLQVGGSEIHIGIITAIMVGLPLVSQLLFAPFIQSRKKKRAYLLGGIYMRMFALFGIGMLLLGADSLTPALVLTFIYGGLILFSLSGAFAGISYVSLIGTTIPDSLRHRFFLRKQVFWSIGVLLSGILTRYIIKGFSGSVRYAFLFSLASLMLALASIGFWMIREQEESSSERPGLNEIIHSMKSILKEDHTFRNYCLTANILTSAIVLIPFYLPSLIRWYGIPSSFVGTIVLLQMGGMLVSNLIWPRIVGPLGFKGILKIESIGGFAIPLIMVIALAAGAGKWLVFLLFPLLGALSSAHKMSGEAVLVQISNKEKRALYSGIYGAINLTSALAPLLIGILLNVLPFQFIFLALGFICLTAYPLIGRMVCPIDIPKAKEDMMGIQ